MNKLGKKLQYAGSIMVAVLTLIICISNSYAGRSKTNKPRPEINIPELEKQIHNLVNIERQKHGLSPLDWSDELNVIAKKHSQDMADRKYFSHYSPEGNDFLYRYEKERFNCEIHIGNYIYQGAENIFLNNLFNSVTYINDIAYYDWNTQGKIAKSTVEGWMKSPGHRHNILTLHWKTEGIGIIISDEGRVFITQNFC